MDERLRRAERAFAHNPSPQALALLERRQERSGVAETPLTVFERMQPVVNAGAQASAGHWAWLIRFVAQLYEEPLRLDAAVLKRLEQTEKRVERVFPRVLREWMLLIEPRVHDGWLTHLSPTFLGLDSLLHRSDTVEVAFEGTWRLHLELEPPRLRFKHWGPGEPRPDRVLSTTLPDLATAAVMEATLNGALGGGERGALGKLRAGAHARQFMPCHTRAAGWRQVRDMRVDPDGLAHLLDAYTLLQLAGKTFVHDAAEDTWGHYSPPGDTSRLTLVTLTPEARERRDTLRSDHERAWDAAEAARTAE